MYVNQDLNGVYSRLRSIFLFRILTDEDETANFYVMGGRLKFQRVNAENISKDIRFPRASQSLRET